MSSDDEFDSAAYKAFEDQLYEEQNLSGSEDDLDSDIEEALYSQVHYASSLLVSEHSTPAERTPKKTNLVVGGLDTQGRKYCLDNSIIEISSDDDDDDDDDDGEDDDDDDEDMDVDDEDYTDNKDSREDVKLTCSSSYNYPEVVNIFSDEIISTSLEKTSKDSTKVEPGEITENWDLNERDLEDSSSVTKQRPRYYTPGKGLSHVRCYNCNEKGHLSQHCPEPKKSSVCFLCGGIGHVKRYCPNELCFNCYEPGHMSKNCRKPRRRSFDRCKRCHVLGHLANECPDRWRQYHLTTQVGPIIRPVKPVSSPPSVSCYNCGNQGHYGHECREENAIRRNQLPSPFVVHYDGCQMSSSREKINYDKRNPTRRFRDERQYQPLSEGFRDQPRQQEYGMDRGLFQPPPEKIQKINDDGDVRRASIPLSEGFRDQPRQQEYDMDRGLFQPPPEKIQKINDDGDVRRVSFHGDRYNTSEFNSPYTDPTPKRKKNKNKREETTGINERIVEILDPSPHDDSLLVVKRKKTKKRGKQQWRGGDNFDNNFDNNNFDIRNNSQQRNDKRFSNPHRNEDYRSFEERQFSSGRASFDARKGGKEFVSNRGFRFNNETRRKKSNPQYFKRYTF